MNGKSAKKKRGEVEKFNGLAKKDLRIIETSKECVITWRLAIILLFFFFLYILSPLHNFHGYSFSCTKTLLWENHHACVLRLRRVGLTLDWPDTIYAVWCVLNRNTAKCCLRHPPLIVDLNYLHKDGSPDTLKRAALHFVLPEHNIQGTAAGVSSQENAS